MEKFNIKPKPREPLYVKEMFEEKAEYLELRLLTKNTEGMKRLITVDEFQRPSLELTGYFDNFTYKRIQLLGRGEWNYLSSLTSERRKEIFSMLCKYEIPCIIWANGLESFPELLEVADANSIAVFSSNLRTVFLFERLGQYLKERFALQAIFHASLVDVYGIGQLYVGKPGIGKSECALDLVERGHRLVADDLVILLRDGTHIIGRSNDVIGHHMEIRGVGVIDIQQLFGIRAIRKEKRIEVVVELIEWDETQTYERIGLEEEKMNILGVDINYVKVPVFPGKNITVIAEVIAMNTLLKMQGINSAKIFNENLIGLMKKSGPDLKE